MKIPFSNVRSMNQKILVTSITILLSSTVIIGFFVYNHFHALYSESYEKSLQLVMQNHISTVNDRFHRTETIGNLLTAELPTLIPKLETPDDNFKKYKAYLIIEDKLSSFCESTLGQDINYNCYLLLPEKFSVTTLLAQKKDFLGQPLSETTNISIVCDSPVRDQEWFLIASCEDDASYWFSHPDNQQVMWVAQNLDGNFLQNGRIEHYSLGVLLIGIDMSWIKEQFDDNDCIGTFNFIITNSDNKIVYSQDKELIEQNFFQLIDMESQNQVFSMDGESYLLWKQELPNNMHLFSYISVQSFNSQFQDNLFLLVKVFLVTLFIAIIFTAFFSKAVTYPLKRLSTHMQKISAPTPISHNYDTKDEIGILYHTYNEMSERLDLMVQQICTYSKQQEELKYQLLQAQINPHFLYNTLDSVCCVALIHGEFELADTLSSLATLLRYNINHADQLVLLAEELNMVSNYISIQQFRYDNHINYTCDCPTELTATKLPKTIIQPLVENCLQYGSANPDGYRYIHIQVACCNMPASDQGNYTVCITILNEYDNRNQTLDSDVQLLNLYLNHSCEIKRKNSGLGILNVQQRIQFVFGKDYGIRYERQQDMLATIISLPLFISASKNSVI